MISGVTPVLVAVAHSRSSARLKRYCSFTRYTGSFLCLTQRYTVFSETLKSPATSLTPNCMALYLFLRKWTTMDNLIIVSPNIPLVKEKTREDRSHICSPVMCQ